MSNRLWGSLSPSAGQRYWSDLTASPGVVSPSPASLMVGQNSPTVFQVLEVFRTPSTAGLSLSGLLAVSRTALTPNASALAYGGLVPVEIRQLTITPATPLPDYSSVNDLAPTIIYVQTLTPTSAQLSLATLTINVTQGGNIGFINPGVGALSIMGGAPSFIFNPIDNAALSIQGLVPQLLTERMISPDVGSISMQGQIPGIDTVFTWVDVVSPPPLTWRVMT